jgi:hypothetical protein
MEGKKRRKCCYDSFFEKKRKAMTGLLDDTAVTNWIESNEYPVPVHSFRIRSISSSVTVLVSTTL